MAHYMIECFKRLPIINAHSISMWIENYPSKPILTVAIHLPNKSKSTKVVRLNLNKGTYARKQGSKFTKQEKQLFLKTCCFGDNNAVHEDIFRNLKFIDFSNLETVD